MFFDIIRMKLIQIVLYRAPFTKAVVEVSSICHMEMYYIIPVLMKALQ